MSRLVRVVAVLALVLGVSVVPSGAYAATVAPGVGSAVAAGVVGAADPVLPDYTPSPNKWRKYMISQVSSVLGNLTPKKWRAENIANQYQYSHSWELWQMEMGIDGVKVGPNGEMIGIKYTDRGQGTYVDVAIEGLEESWKKKSAKVKADMAKMGKAAGGVPATKIGAFSKLVRGAGGALVVVGAYEGGAWIGSNASNAVGGWFGFDANGTVCSMFNDGSVGSGIGRTLSGQDCTAFDMAADYVRNQDALDEVGPLEFGGGVMTYVGIGDTYSWGVRKCFTGTVWPRYPAIDDRYVIQTLNAAGNVQSAPSRVTSPGAAGCASVGYVSTADVPGNSLYGNGLPVVIDLSTGEVVAEMPVTKGDPERVIDCVITMTDGSTVVTSGQPYKESGGSLGVPACGEVPEGKVPASIALNERTPGQDPVALYNQPVGEDAQKMFTDYEECLSGSCALDLIKLDEPGAPSCFDLDEGCPGWFEDPDKTSKYQCRYGVHNVDLKECAVYAGLFTPGRTAVDAPYSDPSTGEWSGGKNTPAQGEQAMLASVQDPESVRSCDLSDIGFDPIGWVVRPGQCLLQWAFVPRPVVVEAGFAGAGEAWEGKPPAVIAEAAETMALTPSASGCAKPVTVFGATFNIIDACSGPMAGIAAISTMVTSAGMVILVLVVLRRQIAGMVGYNQGQG